MSVITDKNIILKESFDSEYDVKRNSGNITGTFSFNNGICNIISGLYTNSKISLYRRSQFSIRIRMKFNNSIGNFFIGSYGSDVTKIVGFGVDSTNYYSMLSNGSSNSYIYSAAAFDSNWHEWIMIYDGSLTENYNRLKLYRDGTYLTPEGQVGTIPEITPNINDTFGTYGFTIGNIADKSFDFIEIYNKALSAEEVSNLYNRKITDVKKGLILDIDAINGVIKDRCGNSLTMSGVVYKKDKVGVCNFNGTSPIGIMCPLILPSNNLTFNTWARISRVANNSYGFHTLFGSFKNQIMLQNSYNSILIQFPTISMYHMPISRYLWNMFTLYIKSNGDAHVYLNGKRILVVGGSTQSFTTPKYFGASNSFNFRMTGYQNQMRIYNRVLTNLEIAQLYNYQKKNYE